MKQRNYNLDLLRVVLSIMVITIHIANYFCRGYVNLSSYEYVFSLFLNTLSRISVPCFLMLSGYLLLDRNENVEKTLKRSLQMLSVLIVWDVIYYVFNTYYMQQTKLKFTELIHTPAEAHLWYLYVLVPVYFCLPFLQAMLRNMDDETKKYLLVLGTIWIGIVWILYINCKKPYYNLPSFGQNSYIFYLFCGYYIKTNQDKIKNLLKSKYCFGVYILLSIITTLIVFNASVAKGKHMDRWLAYGSPLMIVAAICFFIFILNIKIDWTKYSKVTNMIKICSDCSFGVYLFHVIILDHYKLVYKAGIHNAFIATPILLIGIYILSIFIVFLIRKTIIGKQIT